MENLRKYWLVAGVLFSLMIVISGCEDDDDEGNVTDTEVRFDNIELSADAEVHSEPVTSDGTGTLNATYDKETNIISYDISWTLGNVDDNTVGMHFHGPASVTENAGVVIGIDFPTDNYSGTVSGDTRPLTQEEEDDLLSGLWYLNIHSTTYPAGELRGQLNGGVGNGNNNNNGGNGTGGNGTGGPGTGY